MRFIVTEFFETYYWQAKKNLFYFNIQLGFVKLIINIWTSLHCDVQTTKAESGYPFCDWKEILYVTFLGWVLCKGQSCVGYFRRYSSQFRYSEPLTDPRFMLWNRVNTGLLCYFSLNTIFLLWIKSCIIYIYETPLQLWSFKRKYIFLSRWDMEYFWQGSIN